MRQSILLLSIFLTFTFCVTTSFSPSKTITGEWFFLGEKKVGFGVDHDVIHFGNWKDDVRQIKLKITDGPLKMFDMKVHFDNGGVQDIQLRNRFAQGSESRVIDLDGGLRHLSKIEFWYETRGFARGRSRVAVWGRN